METTAFPVRRLGQEKYNVQQEKASKNTTIASLLLKIVCLIFKSTIFALWKQIDRKK
jgi:hypothetical protein